MENPDKTIASLREELELQVDPLKLGALHPLDARKILLMPGDFHKFLVRISLINQAIFSSFMKLCLAPLMRENTQRPRPALL